MQVVYVEKAILDPAFGMADEKNDVAYVRGDLPESARKFVVLHELYHLKDKAKWWVWREVKANVAGALKNPAGFMLCLILSFRPKRLRYYWRRITGKDQE
jgi:hypothetical protein